eukprot:TRINITY_DN7561_c0_g1_i1.p1 TRINITY_DN7561_c0_g1~~TRINITY_DN7561_c0_g1_i1.p1  ORF type:complete len:423 (-),score=116.71 TRINITY_DN7561_c0_g1_i1:22-1290(-)
MVRDAHGRKMSKSLGNVIDPIDVIEGISLLELQKKLEEGNLDPREIEKAKAGQQADFPKGIAECGTDALRFALCAYTSQGRDVNLDINRVVAYRNFCNKLWNATRFALSTLGQGFVPESDEPRVGAAAALRYSQLDRWILARLNLAISEANTGMDTKVFNLAQSTTAIFNFWLYELCDVYLEGIKPVMYASDDDAAAVEQKKITRNVLFTCLDNGLRLIHPFMPFISEELWQRLPRRTTFVSVPSIMLTAYPETRAEWQDAAALHAIGVTFEAVKAIRSLRSTARLTPQQKPAGFLIVKDEATRELLAAETALIVTLSDLSSCTVTKDKPTEKNIVFDVMSDVVEVALNLAGLVDAAAEISKLQKKKDQIEAMYLKLKTLTEGPEYHKVPEKVREQNSVKLAQLSAELQSATDAVAAAQQLA